jgi:translation elongation factor EF-Ts
MIQFSCETDFVAKTDRFRDGLGAILDTVHGQSDLVWSSSKTEEDLKNLTKELNLLVSLDPDAPK